MVPNRNISSGRYIKNIDVTTNLKLVMRVTKVEKRILETIRGYDNSLFILAEKMYESLLRKKERGELNVNSFEMNLLEIIQPFLEDDLGLKNKISNLLFISY